jgi:uncharacterized membrane protein YbaN (DUF454 family)
VFLLCGGGLFLVLAGIGLFLPVWPTTPFVLVAAACFSVYPPLYQRILRIRFFREYFDAWSRGKRISRNTRAKSLIWLWAALVLSMVLVNKPWLYILLACVGVIVTWHLLTIDGIRKRQVEKKAAKSPNSID